MASRGAAAEIVYLAATAGHQKSVIAGGQLNLSASGHKNSTSSSQRVARFPPAAPPFAIESVRPDHACRLASDGAMHGRENNRRCSTPWTDRHRKDELGHAMEAGPEHF